VLLQHLAFEAFGPGYKPMLGFTFAALVLTALFWASLLEYLPRNWFWVAGIAALAPILVSVNPLFPYTLVLLSMLFSMLFVLQGRLDLALAASTIGCLAVPSMPLVLAILLVICIVVAWATGEDRRVSRLARQLAPGVLLYAALSGVLALFFGVKSVMATALPIAGAKYYQSNGWGTLSASLAFLHPPGHTLKYYAAYYTASPVTWFCLCTLLLTVCAAYALVEMVRQRQMSSRGTFVVLACSLQLIFMLVAYGAQGQHSIYDPVLAAATLTGVSLLPSARLRKTLLIAVIGLGALGESYQLYRTYLSWQTTRPGPNTAGLYADPGFADEWSQILRESRGHKVLALSYATGIHNYYPQVESPEVWFVQPGLLYPADMQRILGQIEHADTVVEDMTSPTTLVDYNPQVQAELARMRLTSSTAHFRVWQRDNTTPIVTATR